MKHAFTKGLFVAATATLIAACSTDDAADQMPVAPGKIEVSLKAALPQSRAQIEVDESNGRFSGSWEATDELTVYAKGSQTDEETQKFTYDASSKVFKGKLADATQDWTYQAVYPAVDATPLNIPFGAERTQKGSNFNGAYDPLVSAPVTHAGAEPGKTPQGEAVTFGLNRLTAILALTFETDDATVKAEKVKSVALTAAGKTIAAKSFDITRDDQSGALNASEPSETITLSYEAGSEPAAASFKAYFNVPADTYGKLSVVITTEGHTKALDLTTDGIELLAGELAYTTKKVSGWEASGPAAPTLEWKENPSFAEYPISKPMDIHVDIQAAAGIQNFIITVESKALSSVLPFFGFTATEAENTVSQDIASDDANADIIAMLGLTGSPKGKTEKLSMDLSTLVPMILDLENAEGSHKFTLQLTDVQNRTLIRTLTFTYEAPAPKPSFSISTPDLWANSATVTVSNAPAGAKIQYKRGETGIWQDATDKKDGTFLIEPKWSDGTSNSAGLTIYSVAQNTGIFAGATYYIQLIDAEGSVLASNSIEAQSTNPTIPNSTMSDWSTKLMTGLVPLMKKYVSYPNADGESYWDSGNNYYSGNSSDNTTGNKELCQNDNGSAKLKGQTLASFFAAGNIFTGSFEQSGTTGIASFGQNYTWNARPRGLKLSYKASIGIIDKKGSKDPDETIVVNQTKDKARIFVCIVNWTSRHGVKSGMGLDPATFWDPAKQSSTPNEGDILAYGDLVIEDDVTDWTSATLDLKWYNKNATKPTNDFTLVISCATSVRGDYLTGSTNSFLWVDDFEWVY